MITKTVAHAREKCTPHPPRYTVARIRTYEAACALGVEDNNLSWNEEWFGPRYRLENNMEDNGTLEQVWYAFLCAFDAPPV